MPRHRHQRGHLHSTVSGGCSSRRNSSIGLPRPTTARMTDGRSASTRPKPRNCCLSGAEQEVRIQFPPADSLSLSGFRLRRRKDASFPPCGGHAGRQRRQRRAKPSSVGPSSVGVSVGPYSSTAVLRVRFAISAALAASKVGCLGSSDLGGALSSDRLKQSRAGSVDRARPMAAVSAPAACLRSGGMAGARREWLA